MKPRAFSYGLISIGIIQILSLLSVNLIPGGNIQPLEAPLTFLFSLATAGVGIISLYKPEGGWYAGMFWSVFTPLTFLIMLMFTPLFSMRILITFPLYIFVLVAGLSLKDQMIQNSSKISENGINSRNDLIADESIDIDEVFSETMEKIEEAKEIDDKPEKITREHEILEEFGEKAGKAKISDEKLETYSDAIISETSHIEKETILDKVETVKDSLRIQENNEIESSPQENQGPTEPKETYSYKGRTKKNALIGLVITVVSYVTVVAAAGAPFIGAFFGGFLQREGITGGFKVGLVQSIFMVLPALFLGLFGSAFIAQAPLIGPVLAGAGTTIIILILFSHAILFGILGGIFGGIQRIIWNALFG